MNTVKLSDVCEFRRGLTYKKTDEVSVSNNIVLRANNIDLKNFKLNFDELKYISDKIEIPLNKYIEKDSTLICIASGSKSHLGKVAYIDKDYSYAFGGFMGLIIPRSEKINGSYLYKVLTSQGFRNLVESLTAGTNINNLKYKDIQNYEFALPSLEEQWRVVERLDAAFEKIDRAIELTEKSIEESENMKESLLGKVFNRLCYKKNTTLGSLCDVIGGGTPSKSKPEYWGGDIRWASVRDMKFEIIKSTEFKITADGLKNSSSNLISANNVIIASRVGLGKVCWINEDTAINQDLRAVIPKDDAALIKKFVFWWFKSVSQQIIDAGTGATVQGVTLPFLKSLTVPLLDVKEQRQIVEWLDESFAKIDKTLALRKEKLKKLHDLKQSLLAQSFFQSEVE